ncbi:MAG: recombination regulator RecX [Pseudomonadota bacterium]|jgi:regulatory protein
MDAQNSAPTQITSQQLYHYALSLLARRDHSRTELQQKITRRFGAEARELLLGTLDRLEAEHYQSDLRFAQLYINSRLQRGFGLNRIKLELQQKGISKALFAPLVLDSTVKEHEQQQLERIWRKKFNAPPSNSKERYQQQAHLINKGFRRELIELFFCGINQDTD